MVGAWVSLGTTGTAISSNQVGRTDWTPIALAELAFLMLSPAQAVVDRRDHPCRHKNSDKLNIPDDLQVLWLNFGCDASHLAIYDSRL